MKDENTPVCFKVKHGIFTFILFFPPVRIVFPCKVLSLFQKGIGNLFWGKKSVMYCSLLCTFGPTVVSHRTTFESDIVERIVCGCICTSFSDSYPNTKSVSISRKTREPIWLGKKIKKDPTLYVLFLRSISTLHFSMQNSHPHYLFSINLHPFIA